MIWALLHKSILEELDVERELVAKVVKLKLHYFGPDLEFSRLGSWSRDRILKVLVLVLVLMP